MVHDFEDRSACACLRIAGSVDEFCDTSVQDGPGAHGAGFQCDVEAATGEAIVAERLSGGAHGYHLRMAGRVVVADDAVLAEADDLAFRGDDDGADGHLAFRHGGVRFDDGGADVVFVSH